MATLVFTAACNEGLSAPSVDNLVAGTAQPIQNLVTGIIADDRAVGSTFVYLLFPETMARNTVRIDPNEPRFINELINVPIDNSDFIGAAGWTGNYQIVRTVQQLLASPSFTTLSAGDQSATAGFVRTLAALEYLREVQLRDTVGEVIQGPNPSVNDPIRTKTAVLAYTSALLDSAFAQLTSAGVSASFPFTLPSGYTQSGDFTTTATFARFNRGLKGEVEVMRGLDHQSPCTTCFATAITALNTAIGSLGAAPSATQLQFGPYYQYNPSAPESFTSPLVDNHIFLTNNFVSSIQAGDKRAAKIVTAATPSSSVSGLQLTFRDPITDPTIGANLTRPIALRRAADWYLFRAQAEAESGNLAAATADVNAVHVGEGGLAALPTFASVAAARQQILYEMRYSLVYEGPYYLTALREYSAFNRAYVTQPGMPSVSSDPTHSNDALIRALPIPSGEAAARGGNITPQP